MAQKADKLCVYLGCDSETEVEADAGSDRAAAVRNEADPRGARRRVTVR